MSLEILFFAVGIAVGSFLNVVVLRGEHNEMLNGRSHCMQCRTQLRWFELIPVLSFLLQRGRCRNCAERLLLQYPIVELGTGVLFVSVFSHVATQNVVPFFLGLGVLALHLVVWSMLVAIVVYDIRTKTIPDKYNVLFAFSALVLLVVTVVTSKISPWSAVITLSTGPLLFFPFYALWKVSDGRWIGLGDGKFAWGMGWFLGPALGVSAVLYAFWLGAGIVLLAMLAEYTYVWYNKKNSRVLTCTSEIPFAPFLVLGTACAYFSGVTVLTLFSHMPFLW